MATNTVGIDKEVEVNRKENLRDHRLYWIGRRTQDVILSSLALVVLSPVMLATAIAIVVDDPSAGPVFSQERIGRNGKPFKFYKFRSMCPNAEAKLDDLLDQNEMDGPVFKIKDDPRITRVGKFIRKTSIDELPQLWNILKGDMSIVGPRPALPREVEQYGDYEKQRLYVTPGLSCYWQIAPHRNDLSFEEWMDLDVKYVKERSFWVDWKIIFKTFKVCLLGRGGVKNSTWKEYGWRDEMERDLRIAVFGQKRLSREGGVEIVVKELCTRMAQQGCQVTCYNRSGHHVSGAEYDDIDNTNYEGIRQKYVPTIEKKGLEI